MSKRKASEKGSGSSSLGTNSSQPWVDLGVVLRNPTHKTRFLKLSKLTIRPTRYPDFDDIRKLGLLDCFRELLVNAALSEYFHGFTYLTSRRLTLEFLSTLEVVEVPDEVGDGTYPGIRFQMLNKTYTTDHREINLAFGFNPDFPMFEEDFHLQPDVVDTSGLDIAQFWNSLTGKVWEPHRAKTSEIVHPAMRILHRLVVYHLFGKSELGNVATAELPYLWFGTQMRDPTLHLPVNFAEKMVTKWLSFRDTTSTSLELIMGGPITQLAFYHVPNFEMNLVDTVGTLAESTLDISSMSANQWLSVRTSRSGAQLYSWMWKVKNHSWLILPHPTASLRLSESQAGNPLWIPQDLVEHDPVPRNREPPQPRPPRVGTPTVGSSSSGVGGAFDLSALQAQMRAMQDEQRAQGVLLGGIYRMGVDQHQIDPYMNYPMWPPQEGPVPGWHNNAPTYPYHPHRPEGIDYRYPGGSDPRYDPNFPAWTSSGSTLSFPPNYHDSVPPMEQTWGNAPMPTWGNYSDPPSSTMDEDSE